MRLIFAFAVLVAGFVTVGKAHAFQPAVATDGTWHPVTAILGGQEFPKEVKDSIVLKLSGDRYDVRVSGKPDKGTCSIDASVTPNRMTITGTDGPNRDKTLLAIFELTSEDSLRVCYDLTGKSFPTEFKSEPGTTHYLVEYRRELPEGAVLMSERAQAVDGDAIELQIPSGKKFTVRLNGVDAPEMAQPFGVEAKAALNNMVAGKSVRVVTHGEDRVGLVIGDVSMTETSDSQADSEMLVNVAMVRNGFAWHFVRFAPENNVLAEAEKAARASKRGLWIDVNPIAPWDWRKAEAEKQTQK